MLTDYKGLTVQEISEFRRQLKNDSLEYHVVKNTLAKKASEETSLAMHKGVFTGPVGVAFGYTEPIALVKKILEFARSNEKFKIKGGVIEGKVCSVEDIKAIAELPSRETLLAMFIGTMQSPMSKLASALNATIVQFAYAMEALKTKKSVSE